MPFAPSGYKVFRNVRDYGAKGDNDHDNTDAINAAISGGQRCGRNCSATSFLGATVYFPRGTYRIRAPLIQYYYTNFIGDPHDRPIIKGTPDFKGIALIDTDPYIVNRSGARETDQPLPQYEGPDPQKPEELQQPNWPLGQTYLLAPPQLLSGDVFVPEHFPN